MRALKGPFTGWHSCDFNGCYDPVVEFTFGLGMDCNNGNLMTENGILYNSVILAENSDFNGSLYIFAVTVADRPWQMFIFRNDHLIPEIGAARVQPGEVIEQVVPIVEVKPISDKTKDEFVAKVREFTLAMRRLVIW